MQVVEWTRRQKPAFLNATSSRRPTGTVWEWPRFRGSSTAAAEKSKSTANSESVPGSAYCFRGVARVLELALACLSNWTAVRRRSWRCRPRWRGRGWNSNTPRRSIHRGLWVNNHPDVIETTSNQSSWPWAYLLRVAVRDHGGLDLRVKD